MEQGRGVFLNQIAPLRSPLENIAEGMELADESARLASRIHVVQISITIDCAVTTSTCKPLSQRFENYPVSLVFSLSLFSDLQHAARGGPVVIVNATCHALFVFLNRDPVHAPLQTTKFRLWHLSSGS